MPLNLTRWKVPGELNTSGVVNSSRTVGGLGRQGISPPHRGSIPILLESRPPQGPSPPGDDPHEGEPGGTRFANVGE
jgi:hypothetical protein